jgi:hypothetical protein
MGVFEREPHDTEGRPVPNRQSGIGEKDRHRKRADTKQAKQMTCIALGVLGCGLKAQGAASAEVGVGEA